MSSSDVTLVTGAAGFIGFHVCRKLLELGRRVVGADCVNDYYDVRLEEGRLAALAENPSFRFERIDLADRPATEKLFAEHAPARVVHLAAQAATFAEPMVA